MRGKCSCNMETRVEVAVHKEHQELRRISIVSHRNVYSRFTRGTSDRIREWTSLCSHPNWLLQDVRYFSAVTIVSRVSMKRQLSHSLSSLVAFLFLHLTHAARLIVSCLCKRLSGITFSEKALSVEAFMIYEFKIVSRKQLSPVDETGKKNQSHIRYNPWTRRLCVSNAQSKHEKTACLIQNGRKSYKQKATALCRMLRRMVGNNSNPLLLSPPLCHSPHRIVCWKALTRYSLRSVHRVALNHLSYCWQEWNRWERSDCPKLCIDSWHISVIEQTDLLIFAIPLLEEAKWSPGSFGTRSQDHSLSNGHSKLTN